MTKDEQREKLAAEFVESAKRAEAHHYLALQKLQEDYAAELEKLYQHAIDAGIIKTGEAPPWLNSTQTNPSPK